ncbi:MAG: DUF3883 domain-containing protein [Gallicola sp.]|nr:DUF3883 domain-containing protein [Gallicola sp.]
MSQGFLLKYTLSSVLHINPEYLQFITNLIYKNRFLLTLEDLKKRLEKNEIAGEKAEYFVLEYERRRLKSIHSKIKLISHMDVNAGYDILSFNSEKSSSFDRYIEVKAISNDTVFYWSRNEFTVAKLKDNNYFLYLVELSKINDRNYSPIIIQNPVKTISDSDSWLLETDNYKVTRLSIF